MRSADCEQHRRQGFRIKQRLCRCVRSVVLLRRLVQFCFRRSLGQPTRACQNYGNGLDCDCGWSARAARSAVEGCK